MDKKGMELPVNIVVMTILGIVLFGLGMGIFAKISSQGDERVDNMQLQIEREISSLKCQGDQWVCSGENVIKNGKQETFALFITNHDSEKRTVTVKIKYSEPVDEKRVSNALGSIKIITGETTIENIAPATTTKFPFVVKADQVSKKSTFITTVTLLDENGDEISKAPLTVIVE